MPKLTRKLPKYSHLNGVGFYWLNGKRVYLPGKYNSPESLASYHEAMSSLSLERTETSSGKQLQTANGKMPQLSVKELVDMFLEWGKTYYLKNGQPSRTTGDFERSSRATVLLFGGLPAEKFTQREMIVVQNHLVGNGLARKTVNDYVSRTKRIFNWGVESGLIEPETAMRLKFVKSLQKGRTKAPDLPPRQAVPDHVVDSTLPHLPSVVRDMVQIQRSTGMRPGEVFSMTWGQIDKSDDIWIYMPSHKTQHHGIVRPIPLNSKCQSILARYNDTPSDGIIFSPRRTVRENAEFRAARRKTPMQPSQVERKKRSSRQEELVGEAYTRFSYRNAVRRACERAGIENWTPYQLRHSTATNVAHTLSKEDAMALLGHTSLVTTEIYLHNAVEKVKDVARRMENKNRLN